MRTSLNEIKQIEDHLFNRFNQEDTLLMEARLLLDDDLQQKVACQQQAYQLIHLYSRRRMKEEIESVHQQLFQESRYQHFKNKILHLFSKP